MPEPRILSKYNQRKDENGRRTYKEFRGLPQVAGNATMAADVWVVAVINFEIWPGQAAYEVFDWAVYVGSVPVGTDSDEAMISIASGGKKLSAHVGCAYFDGQPGLLMSRYRQ